MENIIMKFKLSKESEFTVKTFTQTTSVINKIKETYFKDSLYFRITVNYFKKITKEKTLVEIIINRKLFELTFDFTFLKPDSRKDHRKKFSCVLIDDILETFNPVTELIFNSDNLNFTSPYTFRYLTKNLKSSPNLQIKNIDFNNFVFDNKNVDFELLSNLSKLKIHNLSIFFSFDKIDRILIENLVSGLVGKSMKKLQISLNCKYLMTETFQGLEYKNLNIIDTNLKSLQMNILKYFPDKSILLSENDKYKILNLYEFLMKSYFPGDLEVNFSEIIRANIKNTIKHFFRKINIIYSKQLFFTVNLMKDMIFSKILNQNKNGCQRTFSSIDLCSRFVLNPQQKFKITTKNFALKFSNIESMNLEKWNFYFLQEYKSNEIRKSQSEDIIRKLYAKNDFDFEDTYKVHEYKLAKFDLNTVSRVLSQISGYSKAILTNGDRFFIGGRTKTFDERHISLNSITLFNYDYSQIRIVNYHENYFTPSFNMSNAVYRDSQILICGGLSVSSFLPLIKKNPVFLINVNNFSVTKIVPEGEFFPGLILEHKISIVNENKIVIQDGYTLNDSGSFSRGVDNNKLMKNIAVYEFDFVKKRWRLIANPLLI